jgi:hypothetical protein
MNYLSHPSVILSDLLTRSTLLFLLTVLILTFILPDDAFSRTRSRTVGGTSTDLEHHGLHIRCTWPEYEGEWGSESIHPISVTHSAGDSGAGEYATCSGWNSADEVTFVGGDVDHGGAPYESGKFLFNVTYTSSVTTTCTEDHDSGIGNNCNKFTDQQNKKHGGGSSTNTSGATLACRDDNPGTTLTYQFFCADGVDVSGFLTLVSIVAGNPQVAPAFTECSAARVAADACTMQYGGVPTKTIKVKGQTQTVVDAKACLEAFPLASVSNALGTDQTQDLEAGAILFYQETAFTGNCDSLTDLPTEEGSPSTAYGRYCQSDIDTFDDNVAPNVYAGDPADVDGFDNELRVCQSNRTPHIGEQDVETIELSDLIVDSQPSLNLNCKSGGNTDSGGFKVTITDQAKMLASNVDVTPLSDAPTLEGVSPTKAVINTDEFGVETLELTYPTCEDLSVNVIANNNLTGDDNNTNVVVELLGQSDTAETSLSQAIKALIEIKVNGL